MWNGRIDACCDSHVHWAATGEFSERLALGSLQSAADILKLDPKPGHAGWVLGFGWDEAEWPDRDQIHRQHLDRWCSTHPVLFTRADGHAGWANTAALLEAGWITGAGNLCVAVPGGSRVELDGRGQVRGILVGKAYEQFLRAVPTPAPLDLRRHLLKACKIFHGQGFTHIRDVGGSKSAWEQAFLLEQTELLGMAVEMFFHLENSADLTNLCDFVRLAKSEPGRNLLAKGIKIFADGALGPEGAWLSREYPSGSGTGLQLKSDEEIETVCKTCWQAGLEVAVHTNGDAAVHQMALAVQRLKSKGIQGRLHLEHLEIARPESIELLKGVDVICHLQPCHWLSDRRWLKDKVGERLYGWSFPWRRLQEAEIAFDFGSDSPIEAPSVARTLQALEESAKAGIPRLLGLPQRYLSHPDRSWAPNSYTIFEEGIPVQLVLRGDHL